jgi:hypothetical protein
VWCVACGGAAVAMEPRSRNTAVFRLGNGLPSLNRLKRLLLLFADQAEPQSYAIEMVDVSVLFFTD